MKQWVKIYLTGLIPFLLILGWAGLSTKTGSITWQFNGLSGYFIFSYLLIYPYVERYIFQPDSKDMLKIDPESRNPEQRALQQYSSIANNGFWGIARMSSQGKGSKESKVNLFFSDFVLRILVIAFGVFFVAFHWVKQWLKKPRMK